MRLLVLGGTRFLSRSVTEQAVARGWDVTCACRGESGAVPPGATHLVWDRALDAPAELLAGRWDAVVDVSRTPSHVGRAVAAVPDAHWVFVSTINVYADNTSPAMEPLVEAIVDDVDLAEEPDAYGPMKVTCESLVMQGAASSMVVRPGLIVGPDDGSGRFGYWPERLARASTGEEVLAPGSPDDVVQVIDVRDLAGWIVDACEPGTTGVFDAVGLAMPIADLLGEVAGGVGAEPTWTWVDTDFLTERGVEPWAGPDAIPLWLPRPDYDGMMSHSPQPAIDAGLRLRPVADTARDSLGGTAVGISAGREAELLAAWHASR
ncbi:epimerase [Nocardioides currus]|uniref:Epimerase n=1 Tax=Nocardioides currus TaxID=2133958 RepID=A0A2R7YYF1_9ACTN|nr:epimerase [Nocardioides currus]PUA81393.1 epimerase [Nocardioides currus]